ncbi:MAG: hypothetical protein AAFN78_14465 [Pseudomonadota bacterium]
MPRLHLFATMLVGVFFAVSADAALIRAFWVGTVVTAEDGNAYGASVGETVTGFAEFDSAQLVYFSDFGVTVVVHETDPDYQLSLTIGTQAFVQSDDAEFADGLFPTLVFAGDVTGGPLSTELLEASFLGPDMATCLTPFFPDCDSDDGLGLLSALTSGVVGWEAYDELELVASGSWDAGSVKIQAIPLPAAFLLMGTALAGIGFTVRRK